MEPSFSCGQHLFKTGWDKFATGAVPLSGRTFTLVMTIFPQFADAMGGPK